MAIQPMFPVGYIGTGIIPSEEGLAAAGATDGAWAKGAILVSPTTSGGEGLLTQGGTNPTKIIGVAEAAGPQAAASTTKVRFIPTLPNVEFEATVSHGGTAIPLATTMLYCELLVTKSGSGASAKWYADTTGAGAGGVGGGGGANARFRVLRLKDAVGTSDGRVFGVFTVDNTIYGAS